MSRYARKVDVNHAQFASLFQRLGIAYQDTSRYPAMLDFIIQTQGGRLVRLEVKASESEELTEQEKKTFDRFPGACYRVWEPEQAYQIWRDE